MLQYILTWMRTLPMYRALKQEAGQDLAEYALLIALIALIVIAMVALLGKQINNVFRSITEGFSANGVGA